MAFAPPISRATMLHTTSVYFHAHWFDKHALTIMDVAAEIVRLCAVQTGDQLFEVDNPVEVVLLAPCLHWVANLCYQSTARRF